MFAQFEFQSSHFQYINYSVKKLLTGLDPGLEKLVFLIDPLGLERSLGTPCIISALSKSDVIGDSLSGIF